MIFLSHNHKDKAVVEQIAIRLRDIYGQEKVFYDSWSMQPGDGIIDKMNEGLGKCELFLFCVSKNSLQSNMVKLEWQNAVMKATSGNTKIVPIKLDDCLMPPILTQSLYIDLFGQGLEIALRQIVDVTEGRNTYSEGPKEFSNLRAYTYTEGDSVIVECHAEHYMEAISHFLFLINNEKSEIAFKFKSGSMHQSGFHNDIKLDDGSIYNGQFMSVEKATVPGFPFIVEITKQGESNISLVGVLHEKKQGQFKPVPLVQGKRVV
jgi:hypothetical protein